MINELFDNFLLGKEDRKWLETSDINVYVRKSRKYFDSHYLDCIDLANINVNVKRTGQGIFSDFLEYVESKDINIFVENVLTSKFQSFFIKRGYHKYREDFGIISFLKIKDNKKKWFVKREDFQVNLHIYHHIKLKKKMIQNLK